MGEFKGIINVFTQEQKDHQLETKEKHIKEILESIQKVRDSNKENDAVYMKELEIKIAMLQNQVGRHNFRQKMISLGLGHFGILKQLMNIEAESFIKR